jgi:hypothetical protein
MDSWDFAANYKVIVEGSAQVTESVRKERVETIETTRIVRLTSQQFAERARRLNLPPHVSTFTLPPALIVKRVNYVAKRLPLSDSEGES